MTAITSAAKAVQDASTRLDRFPETVHVTPATIRAWRVAGYNVCEHRKANWLYLVARGYGESVVYKLVGPRFHDGAVVYEGFRIA